MHFDINKLKHLGKNSIIGKNVLIRYPKECIIGDNVIIDNFTYISAPIEIGDGCHIASNVVISGGSKGKLVMDKYSGIGAHSAVLCASSNFHAVNLDMPSVPEDIAFCEIENHPPVTKIGALILIGTHCTIMPGTDLPDGTAWGSHSLITNKQYEKFTLYGGIPAKRLGRRDTTAIEQTKTWKELYEC